MTKTEWRAIRVLGGALLTLVALHGVRGKAWRDAHTVLTIVSAIAMAGEELA